MSVINRVLKDLDRQGAAVFVPEGVKPVTAAAASSSRRPLLLAIGVLLSAGLAAWQYWPTAKPKTPVATPPVVTATAAPPQAASAEAVPSAAPEPAPALAVASGEPAVLVKTPRETAPPIARNVEPTQAPRPLAGRLDTRLPQMAPVQVIKANHPATPAEQAAELFRQASRLIEQGRAREARGPLDEALLLEPGHAGARQTLAVLLMEAGEGARAEALLREGIKLQPADLWYVRSLAQLHLQRGETEQALAVLKAGLGQSPDAAYWGFYAALLNRQGRHEETAQAYRQASRLDPGHGPWWIGLAVALEKSGQRQAAIEAYDQALQTRLASEVREFAVHKRQELAGH